MTSKCLKPITGLQLQQQKHRDKHQMASINLSRHGSRCSSQDIWTWQCGFVWLTVMVWMQMAQLFHRVQLTVQLATLWPQIKGLMQINVQQRHTCRQYMHMIFTLNPLTTQAAFIKPWQTAKLAQFVWVLPAGCLQFKPDWVWSWKASSTNQSLWHKQIKQRMYSSPGSVSKTPRYTHSAPGQHPWWFVL